jgi:hypothetical protein
LVTSGKSLQAPDSPSFEPLPTAIIPPLSAIKIKNKNGKNEIDSSINMKEDIVIPTRQEKVTEAFRLRAAASANEIDPLTSLPPFTNPTPEQRISGLNLNSKISDDSLMNENMSLLQRIPITLPQKASQVTPITSAILSDVVSTIPTVMSAGKTHIYTYMY